MAAHPAPLGVDVEDSGENVHVTISGELDLSTAQRLADVLRPLADPSRRPPLQRLTVEAEKLSFADVAGLDPLIRCAQALESRGGSVSLQHAPRNVRRVIELLGLAELVGLSPRGVAGG